MANWKSDERVSAEFSPCGKYRYWLRVDFEDGLIPREKGTLAVTGLNPSKANLKRDDQTMRKGVNWAKRQGYDSLLMLNAFAFRATLPADLKAAEDPYGGQTAWKLFQLIKGCTLVVAWGGDGKFKGRAAELIEAARVLNIDVWCFGKNKDGSPLHPCYARLPDELIRYS
jgi:hypothetical protein